MSVKRFFLAAVDQAESLLVGVDLRRELAGHRPADEAPAIAVLDRALTRAMIDSLPRYGFRLRRGQGVQARARLLVAAAHLGLNEPTMQPGESVAEWLGRAVREIRHAQIVPLLRAAARVRRVEVRDLEARAP